MRNILKIDFYISCNFSANIKHLRSLSHSSSFILMYFLYKFDLIFYVSIWVFMVATLWNASKGLKQAANFYEISKHETKKNNKITTKVKYACCCCCCHCCCCCQSVKEHSY